jgi:hypothetical protein
MVPERLLRRISRAQAFRAVRWRVIEKAADRSRGNARATFHLLFRTLGVRHCALRGGFFKEGEATSPQQRAPIGMYGAEPTPTTSPEAVDMRFVGTASALTGPIVRAMRLRTSPDTKPEQPEQCAQAGNVPGGDRRLDIVCVVTRASFFGVPHPTPRRMSSCPKDASDSAHVLRSRRPVEGCAAEHGPNGRGLPCWAPINSIHLCANKTHSCKRRVLVSL